MIESEYSISMIEGDMTIEIEKRNVEVTKLKENGFGYGEGGISHIERRAVIGDEMLSTVESVITTNKILVPVDTDKTGNLLDDDGCGDGRSVKTVFEREVTHAKSLNRSKVFGGGVVMDTAMKIGLGEVAAEPLSDVFHDAIETLKDKQISFGAHTDDHQYPNPESEKSGCGAIDLAPGVVANVVKYADKIEETIASLGADTTGLSEVMSNFRMYAEQIEGQPFSGKKVVSEIINNGKIVKELQHNHLEAYVVLNTVEGYTVNQQLVREVSDDQVQVFGVDVWRMQELAARAYPDNESLQHKAFLSELVYTLSVSSTLTTGDLPVFHVSTS